MVSRIEFFEIRTKKEVPSFDFFAPIEFELPVLMFQTIQI